jgi:peptidoglycan-associated lipoprotein
MSPSRLFVLGSIAALAAACSHDQKPPANQASARVVALTPPPKPAPVVAEVPEPPVDTSKTKEGGNAIYFDFDSSVLRDDARPVLQTVADRLRSSSRSLRIEGNCDELGTVEYNLALGEQRAQAAKAYLVALGVDASRVDTISYGEQQPVDVGHDELAWAVNRRAHFLVRGR